jgi:hypothetical protein
MFEATDRAGVCCWKLERWPAVDRAAWFAGLANDDEFSDIPPYGHHLASATVEKVRRGYGRWLDFLDRQGWLDATEPPLARLTSRRVLAYLRSLRSDGNADYTIISRCSELWMAMKIIAPSANVDWIRRPRGVSIFASLKKVKRALIIPDTLVLIDWAIEMMEGADLGMPRLHGHVVFRNGLLLAILAYRARRLRAMAGTRVGKELVSNASAFRIELGPELVKTKRPALLGGRRSDALWISRQGRALSASGISNIVLKTSSARFGTAFATHRFRYSLATTAVLRAPEMPGLAAAVMGISAPVIEQAYARAGQVLAVRQFAEVLEHRRARLRITDLW